MKSSANIKKALTGGAAAAEALRQIEPEVMPIYPITPQTPIIETYAKFQADGEVDTEIIRTESEHSVMSAAVGASAAGARTVTATSSQGLALMNEILYVASGMRLPILMLVSARALGAPINIHGDHSDVMGARDTGWIQIFSENAQEAYDNTIIGMKMAEDGSLPVMVIMDGFFTSHTVENLETLDTKKVKSFVGEYKPNKYLLNVNDPVTFGPVALQNSYFEFKADQEEAMQQTIALYQKSSYEFEKISGRFYDFFESYKAEDADYVIVVAGSTAGTTKDVVDKLRSEGKKVGLIKIRLFRPFPHGEIEAYLAKGKNIAVLDRAISMGTNPPIYSDVVTNLFEEAQLSNFRTRVASYVYGLGGRDIFASDIEKVFEDLMNGEISRDTKYIGLKNE